MVVLGGVAVSYGRGTPEWKVQEDIATRRGTALSILRSICLSITLHPPPLCMRRVQAAVVKGEPRS